MNRKEKQARLQSIKKSICAITLTYDMGVQIDYISGRGAQESMGDFSQWPCLRLSVTDMLRQFKKRLIDGDSIDDHEMMADSACSEICTVHDLYFKREEQVDGEYLTTCLDLIRKELPFVDLSGQVLFAYVALEEWHTQIKLFATYDSLYDFFTNQWDEGVDEYDGMGDDEIDFWYQIAEQNDWDEQLAILSIG